MMGAIIIIIIIKVIIMQLLNLACEGQRCMCFALMLHGQEGEAMVAYKVG